MRQGYNSLNSFEEDLFRSQKSNRRKKPTPLKLTNFEFHDFYIDNSQDEKSNQSDESLSQSSSNSSENSFSSSLQNGTLVSDSEIIDESNHLIDKGKCFDLDLKTKEIKVIFKRILKKF